MNQYKVNKEEGRPNFYLDTSKGNKRGVNESALPVWMGQRNTVLKGEEAEQIKKETRIGARTWPVPFERMVATQKWMVDGQSMVHDLLLSAR